MFKIRTQAIVFGCVLPGHQSPIRMNVLPEKAASETSQFKGAEMSLQEKKAIEGRALVASADKHLETSAWKLKFR